jgi:hypothetical protein
MLIGQLVVSLVAYGQRLAPLSHLAQPQGTLFLTLLESPTGLVVDKELELAA